MLLSACASDGAPIAADLKPVCQRALRVVCVSAEDALTPATAEQIVATNEAIAAGCKGTPAATRCPKGTKAKPPQSVKPAAVTPEGATS